jgi:branched-chain amino acid transport system ATP-binding protein
LRAIVDAGTTVVLVDHDMDLVLTVCDVVHVIESGHRIASGPPEAVRRHEGVAAAYLGVTTTSAPAGGAQG